MATIPRTAASTPVKADAYYPNDYGLYNMAGNVAEWTSTAYYSNAYSFLHDLNPDIRYDAQDEDPESYKRKVIPWGVAGRTSATSCRPAPATGSTRIPRSLMLASAVPSAS